LIGGALVGGREIEHVPRELRPTTQKRGWPLAMTIPEIREILSTIRAVCVVIIGH
jgi:hypothetical protein